MNSPHPFSFQKVNLWFHYQKDQFFISLPNTKFSSTIQSDQENPKIKSKWDLKGVEENLKKNHIQLGNQQSGAGKNWRLKTNPLV